MRYYNQNKSHKKQDKNEQVFESTTSSNPDDFSYLPTSTTGQIIKHEAYVLSYSEAHEQAEWVAYSLDKSDIVYANRDRPFFNEDPKVKTHSADWRSYRNSGYDRGHLCPAGDRRASKKLYDETFYTSNISPQNHNFNSGIWNRLEQKTRYWAKKYGHLYVVTGGVLEDNLPTIGVADKVSVPKQFYKILLDYTKPEIKAIAFLIPNKDSNLPLYKFVVSIDSIEQKTGIDFFPNLPDSIETKLEASSEYKNWSFR
ncbi:DNA/RNA non-specific endonuclease [Tenacibaculum sp. UWU-22]|uniref:DNA/RNA non-specific endonuclease n=1 Tax=Tenacibaculum sp. UWU-22 TaxID=3234187 RepID=UPI0034DB49AF